ncbi:hypothetical protein FRC12_003830, partial [Ceratobasidium sp. 428]
MPSQSNKDIELDIESLSPAVLTKLWNSVVKPQQQKKSVVSSNGPKRTSGNTIKGAAAVGVIKHKSTGEAVERERAANDAHSSGVSASELSLVVVPTRLPLRVSPVTGLDGQWACFPQPVYRISLP